MPKVVVRGLRELRKTMKTAGVDMADMKNANQEAARIVLADAQATAPRRSGGLAASGRAGRAVGRAIVSFGSAQVVYAPVIHWGWRRRGIRSDPFASRSAQRTESRWVTVYAENVNKIIEQVRGA